MQTSYRFSTYEKQDYLTVTKGDTAYVYRALEKQPFFRLTLGGEEFCGAVYAEGRLNYSLKGHPAKLYFCDGTEKKITEQDVSHIYKNACFVKYLTGGSGWEYVLLVSDGATERFVIYHLKEQREIAVIPMTEGLKDIEYNEKDVLLQMTEHRVDTEKYGRFSTIYYRNILWKVGTIACGLADEEMEDCFLASVSVGIENLDDDWESKYIAAERKNKMHFPFFDYFLICWPEDLAVSAYGKYLVQYCEDFDGIIVADKTGMAIHYFELPKEINKDKAVFYYNEEKDILYAVSENVLTAYRIVQDAELLKQVNERYEEVNEFRKKNVFNLDYAFRSNFYKCLYQAKIETICRNEV